MFWVLKSPSSQKTRKTLVEQNFNNMPMLGPPIPIMGIKRERLSDILDQLSSGTRLKINEDWVSSKIIDSNIYLKARCYYDPECKWHLLLTNDERRRIIRMYKR